MREIVTCAWYEKDGSSPGNVRDVEDKQHEHRSCGIFFAQFGTEGTMSDVPSATDKLETKLIRAINSNELQVVQEILSQNPALVEIRDKNGRSILYLACSHGHVECVRILLAHGASTKSYTSSGKSVLGVAVSNQNVHVVKLLLKSPDCDPNHQDNAGTTPLMMAAEIIRPSNVSLELVQLLLQPRDHHDLKPADVNIRDVNQESAFDRCCRVNNDPRVAAELVKAGATIVERCENRHGDHHNASTSLMNAAMNGLPKLVDWLLETAGVDPFATTSHGMDARAFAEAKGHTDVVAVIEKFTSK